MEKKNELKKKIMENQLNLSRYLSSSKDCSKVLAEIKEISDELSQLDLTTFFILNVFPKIYSKPHDIENSVRDNLMNATYDFMESNKIELTVLPRDQQTEFMTAIKDEYSKELYTIFSNDYPNWHKLWILIVKITKEKLHYYTEVINNLFNLLSSGFRLILIEEKLKMMDCWMALFENAGLNTNFISETRRLKVFLKPFEEAYTDSNTTVMLRRFEVFICLIKNLKEHATKSLDEFLKFCHKNLENLKMNDNTEEMEVQQKFFIKIIAILVEVIGHCHNEEKGCVNLNILKFKKPIVNKSNFPRFHQLITRCVIKCTKRINIFHMETCNKNVILRCIWFTLFNLIDKCNDRHVYKVCYQLLNEFLLKSLKKMDIKADNDIIANLIRILLSQRNDYLKDVTLQCLIEILSHVSLKSKFDRNVVDEFVSYYITNEKRNTSIILKYFSCTKYTRNADFKGDIWLMMSSTNLPIEYSKELIMFLIWPFRYLFSCRKSIGKFRKDWPKLYGSKCDTDEKRNEVINEMCNLIENGLSLNFILIFEWFSTFTSDITKEFYTNLFKLSYNMLKKNTSVRNIEPYFKGLFDFLNKYLNYFNDNEEIVKTMCGFIQLGLITYKQNFVLKKFKAFLLKMNKPVREQFSTYFMTELKDLIVNYLNTTKDLEEAYEIGSLLGLDKTTLLSTTNKIKIENNFEEEESLHNTSLQQSTHQNKKLQKKRRNTIDTFVFFDKQVQFNPNNLTEHQLEVYKKRNDNIPALYEDLSRSHSNDLNNIEETSSNSSVNSEQQGKRKIGRVEKELNKLKLNMVDHDFINRLPIKRRRISKSIVDNMSPKRRLSLKNNNKLNVVKETSVSENVIIENANDNNEIVGSTIAKPSVQSVQESKLENMSLKTQSSKNVNKTKVVKDASVSESIIKSIKETTKPKSGPSSTESIRKSKIKNMSPKKQLINKTNKIKVVKDVSVSEDRIENAKDNETTQLKSSPSSTESIRESKIKNISPQKQLINKNNKIKVVKDASISENITESIKDNQTVSIKPKSSSAESIRESKIKNRSPKKQLINKYNKIKVVKDVSVSESRVENAKDNETVSINVKSSPSSIEPIKKGVKSTKEMETTPKKVKNEDKLTTPTKNVPERSTDSVKEFSIINLVQNRRVSVENQTISTQNEKTDENQTISINSQNIETLNNNNTLENNEQLKEVEEELDITPINFEEEIRNKLPIVNKALTEKVDGIVTSPITCHTPDRNSELLNNTVDISPIDNDETNQNSNETMIKTLITKQKSKINLLSTPIKRNQLMLHRCRDKNINDNNSNNNNNSSSICNKNNAEKEYNESELFTFSKQPPSPFVVPGNSILKRKLDSGENSYSPSAKRKRVNFSDPTTTCRKIYLKYSHEENEIIVNENGDLSPENENITEAIPSAISSVTSTNDTNINVSEESVDQSVSKLTADFTKIWQTNFEEVVEKLPETERGLLLMNLIKLIVK